MVHSQVKTSPKNHLPQKVSSEIQSWIKWHSSMPNNIFIVSSTTFMKMFKYKSDFVLSIIYSKQSKNILYVFDDWCMFIGVSLVAHW